MYELKPIDTSNVILPEEMLAMIDKIAENIYDVWSVGSISED